MTLWIAFFRGINVGGRQVLPMAELRSLLEGLGAMDVGSYIQSGNVVFRHQQTDAGRLAHKVRAAVDERFGFAPDVLLLTRQELENAAVGNPFPSATADPKSLHLFFLADRTGNARLAGFEELRAENERIALQDRVLYLHAPAGIGRSKLAERIERLLGVPATARNWRTVEKTLEMAQRAAGT